jgi:DNA repair exonuclease SbcCD ATPase subunit
MRTVIFVWIALLIVVAVLAQQVSGFQLAQIPAALSLLTWEQQFAFGLAAMMVLGLIGSAVWQAEKLNRQDKAIELMRERLGGIRHATLGAEEIEHDIDTAVQHLVATDPEEALTSLSQRLVQAEHRAAAQKSRNDASDLIDRVEEIRHRQKTLRAQLGDLIEKQRANAPVLGELKERQAQIEHSLAEVESDDSGMSFVDRLKQADQAATKVQARLQALQDALATLNRLNDELGGSKAALVPLRQPDGGIATLMGQVQALRDELGQNLDQLETHGDQPLATRVELLLIDKRETERRIAGLDDCVATMQTLGRDLAALKQRHAEIEHALTEAEIDENGRNLADRLQELDAFAVQARGRFEYLEKSLLTLNGIKEELADRQAALLPLQKPDGGLAAVIGEVRLLRDRLIGALDKLESDQGEPLGARVHAFLKSKHEAHIRVAAVAEAFAELDTIRRDIGALFASLSATFNAHAGSLTGGK